MLQPAAFAVLEAQLAGRVPSLAYVSFRYQWYDPESYARKYHPLLAEACLAAAAFVARTSFSSQVCTAS